MLINARQFRQRATIIKILVGVLAIFIGIGAYFGAQQLYYQTPNKVWHDALSNSLQNRSVTITIAQQTNDTDRRQTITYNAGSQNQARSDVVLRSQGNLVVTETIGTTTADYSRYSQIQAKDKDYKNVIGVWAKSEHATGSSSETPLLPGIALRTVSVPGVPLVDVPVNKQVNLYKLLNNAITTDFSKVSDVQLNGRSAKQYSATIKPEAYITYIKALDETLGYKTLSAVTAESYKNQPAVDVNLVITNSGHRLARLTVPGTATYQETYGNYGKAFSVAVPTKTVTAAELQSRLQNN